MNIPDKNGEQMADWLIAEHRKNCYSVFKQEEDRRSIEAAIITGTVARGVVEDLLKAFSYDNNEAVLYWDNVLQILKSKL